MTRKLFVKRAAQVFFISVATLLSQLTLDAQVTLNLDRVSVRQAVEQMQRTCGVSISIRSDKIDLSRTVSVHLTDGGLEDALRQIFRGQDVEWEINGQRIAVIPRKASANTPSAGSPASSVPAASSAPRKASDTVTGLVLDENSLPLVGAVVMEKDGANAITDLDGRFEMSVKSASSLLTFSFFGYEDVVLAADTRSDMEVRMTPQTMSLDETVVVGYGSMTRRDITSSIGSFKPKPSERRDVLSVDQMLQGRIAGVNISTSSGVPGSESRVSIRGAGSLNAGNEPLYVVDGVPITSTSGDMGLYGGGESMTGMATINPADIESVEVLKDAASAAIYGSRATNGVIIITTKSGRKGDAKIGVDASYSLGWEPNTDKLSVATADSFIEMLNDAIDSYNLQFGQNVERVVNPKPGSAKHDWLKDVLRLAQSRNISLNISGGNDNVNYYVSAGVKHQEGVIIDNDLEQYNLKANVSGKAKKWLSYGFNSTMSYTHNKRVGSGYSGDNPIKGAMEQYPWDTPTLPNGKWATKENILVNNNPVADIKESDIWLDTWRAILSSWLTFHIIKDLDFQPRFGGDIQSVEEHVYYGSGSHHAIPSVGNPMGGRLKDGRKLRTTLMWDNTLTWSYAFPFGLNLGAMLGHSVEVDNNSMASQEGSSFPSKEFDVNSAAALFSDVTSSRTCYTLQSFFGRINLNYKNRYVSTLTLRTDGSSRFAPGHRWGWFPSASIGWNVNEEPFWRNKDITLKVRASIGATGNVAGIGAYAWQALATGGFNYNGQNGIGLSSIGNTELTWEKATQTDIGVDLSFWKGALSIGLDLFNKDTDNLLYNKPTMATTGYTSNLLNIGAMNNKGIELSIAGNASAGDFRWHGDFNISTVKNTLTRLFDNDEIITTSNFHALKVGRPVGSFYMIKMLGIYQHDEDVPQYLYENENVRAGDVIYEDCNGDGKIDENDRQFVGTATPLFSGGFNNTFTWKNLELSVFFTYSYGNKVYEYWTGGLRLGNGFWPAQQSVVDSRWTGPGTSNTVPRAIYGHTWNSTRFVSTRFLHDASYLRLRSLVLSYNLPHNLLKKIHLDSLRIYLQADNLFVLTPWPYLDPEVSVSNNATTMGYDWLNPGQPRTVQLGINLKF